MALCELSMKPNIADEREKNHIVFNNVDQPRPTICVVFSKAGIAE